MGPLGFILALSFNYFFDFFHRKFAARNFH